MVSIEISIALFIAGVAVGIAVHRLIMMFVLCKVPDSICVYCEWMSRRNKCKNK